MDRAGLVHDWLREYNPEPKEEYVRDYIKYMKEEYKEFLDELDSGSVNIYKEACDCLWVCCAYDYYSCEYEKDDGDELYKHIMSAISDYEEKLPFSLDIIFAGVYLSNMTKQGRDENGKITKGPNYKAPDIEYLLKLTQIINE